MTTSCICFRRLSVMAVGFLIFSSGVYLYLKWNDIFTQLRGKEMALSPSSRSYPGWKVSPLPLYFDVYLFNWTNPEQYVKGSHVKPHFEEIGPYRFLEKPDKVDIVWHTHNHSVSFRKKASFHFVAAASKGSLRDRITTINTVAHATALRGRDSNMVIKKLLQGSLRTFNEHLWITKTADELMFTGYEDAFVNFGGFLSKFSKDIVVPYDRIGWLYTRNDSSSFDGHFNMYTGTDDIRKMGQIHTWNHMTHNGRFPDKCGEVKGSVGEFYPPNLTPNDSISIYLPNMCRPIPLDYSETVEIHGVKAFKFSGGERSVDNGTLYPEAQCFCVNKQCQPSGVINIGPCKYNSSMYMSYPHFYKTDPSYLEAIEGLHPVREKHEFYMTLEPNSGLVMDVGGGFQANYLLEPIPGISPFDSVRRTFIPLMWCEERVRVTPEIADEIALVPLIILIGQLITGFLLATGLIIICWYPTKFVTQLRRDPKKKAVLLKPLASSKTTSAMMPPKDESREGVSLLEYANSSIDRSINDTVSNGLLESRAGQGDGGASYEQRAR